MTPRFATSAALLAAAALAHSASAQSFTLIGAAPNAVESRGLALSSDGQTVVGTSYRYMFGPFQAGFRWTSQTGRVDVGLSPELPPFNSFTSCSSDASVVAGYSIASSSARARALRYSGPGTFQDLGTRPGHNTSEATGISADGSVVVGSSSLLQQSTVLASSAFRWTAATGMQPITSEFSKAYGVSADGNTIVGEIRNATGINAFKWTPAGGAEILPRIAGTLSSSANAVTPDGSITVGYSGNSAAMWQGTSAIQLTTPLQNVRETVATSVNADGTLIGGRIAFPTNATAGIWTAQTGMIRLSDYLTSRGVTIPAGVNLEYCTGISADGSTITGWATGAITPQGFVATIPAPATAIAFAALILGSPRRRR